MTATVSLAGEKPSPQPSATVPVDPEPYAETVSHWYDHPYLKSKCGKLNVIQIVLGILPLIFIVQNAWLTILEYGILFLIIHSTALTAILLWDRLNVEKLRHLFGITTSVDLCYNATVALLYHVLSFFQLVYGISSFYNSTTRIWTGVFGMLATVAYAYNWWLLYRETLLNRTITTKVEEFNQQQKERGTVQNV